MSLELLTVALLVTGLVLFALGMRRIWRWKLLAGGVTGGVGIGLVTLAMLLGTIASNLHTYRRLTHEAEVARIRFEQTGENTFRAYLTTPDGATRLVDLRGDEWQLDARVLKWHGLANLLGLDSGYQLERLQGRWRDPQRQRREPPTVIDLRPRAGLDLWAFARRHPGWIPWVDAVYGSAVYLPMRRGTQYRVTIGQAGLMARPVNDHAREAVENW